MSEEIPTETIQPFNATALKEAIDKTRPYISFQPNDQKELIIANPLNVTTQVFGKDKTILRLQVVKVGDEQQNPPKQWDITNPGLIDQMLYILQTKAAAWRVIVKRGPGLNKATTYMITHMPME